MSLGSGAPGMLWGVVAIQEEPIPGDAKSWAPATAVGSYSTS